VFDMGGDG
jgi:hypothetical protein